MLGGSQGSIRMAIHDGNGRKGLTPPGPSSPPTKVTIVGANGIYDRENRENGRAIFDTQSFGSQTPPPPTPSLLLPGGQHYGQLTVPLFVCQVQVLQRPRDAILMPPLPRRRQRMR